jgi:CHAT domain
MPEPIKILFLASNPTDISRIRVDKELREVDERISLGSHREQFDLIPQFAVRPRNLSRGLLRYKPHILHFSGHGSTTAGIVLEDDDGKTRVVTATDLAELLDILKDNLRVVVLNSCYSALQASGITQSIDCAIGMNDKVGDQSAIIFAASFYESLAFGRSVDEAFRLGVSGLKTEGTGSGDIPTLLTRQGVDLAKVYLTADENTSAVPAQPNSPVQPGGQVVDIDWKGDVETQGDFNLTGISNKY